LSAASRVTEPDDKALLSKYLAGSSPTSEEEINAIADCCRRLGVLDHAKSLVEDYLVRARSALEEHLSDTAARSSLTAIAETTRSRSR
jgi:geranylgeranyl pyrophosphate synthase